MINYYTFIIEAFNNNNLNISNRRSVFDFFIIKQKMFRFQTLKGTVFLKYCFSLKCHFYVKYFYSLLLYLIITFT